MHATLTFECDGVWVKAEIDDINKIRKPEVANAALTDILLAFDRMSSRVPRTGSYGTLWTGIKPKVSAAELYAAAVGK